MSENTDPKTTENTDPQTDKTDKRVIELTLRDGRLKLRLYVPAGPDGRIRIDADMSADHFGAMTSNLGAAFATMAPSFMRSGAMPCDCVQPEEGEGEEERGDPSPDVEAPPCAPPPPPPGVSYPPVPPQVVR